jgi:spermidine synthase
MLPWVELGRTTVPGDGAELRLMQRGGEFAIMAGSIALMNSRMTGSEIALADVACERLKGRRNVRMLIGGYGMGFTLRAALAGLGTDAKIEVAELVPAVLDWARGPMAELTAGSLDDPRVSIHDGDVGAAIGAAPASYDAILLDVDNGPDGLSRVANEKLYTRAGLETARQALKPSGLLIVWSAAPDRAFAARLGHAGFAVVEEITARAHKGRGGRYVIWVGKKAR